MRLFSTITLATLLMACLGCGPAGMPTLTGTVTIDGKAAPAGISFQFSPLRTGGSCSYAQTDENGNFTAQFSMRQEGIQEGTHRVQLMPGFFPPDMDSRDAERMNPLKKVPKSYYEEVTQVTIEPGYNTLDIALDSK
ncbi:hypothetical protein AB1K70_21895 [Bremerella sp. JC770]|uniref:hypothetical protein n=1 Tax=Bremerella sp. JC770 TaxID=3232137 RepID=UPI00345A21A4